MTVCICIPTYNSAKFLRETVASVYAQTHHDWRILISVEPSSDETRATCADLAATDRRVTIIEQPERLGWVGNYNHLLGRVDTPLFAILFHDDLWAPTHLSTLTGLLDERPEADFAYCATELIGNRTGVVGGQDYLGSAVDRLTAYLTGPFHAQPLRALCRTCLARRGYAIPDYGHEGFFAGRLAIMNLLGLGAGVFHPDPLYRKKIHADSTVRGWEHWCRDRIRDAWAAHVAAAFRLIESVPMTASERHRIGECFMRQTFDFPEIWSPWPGQRFPPC